MSSWSITLATGAATLGGVLFLLSRAYFSETLEDFPIKMSPFLGEYHFGTENIFAMEEISWEAKADLIVTKKICFEDMKPRDEIWMSFLKNVSEQYRCEPQKFSPYANHHNCSIVYLCDSRPNKDAPIDVGSIFAFMIVETLPGSIMLHHPIISLSGMIFPKLEGVLEGFAIRTVVSSRRSLSWAQISSKNCGSQSYLDGFTTALNSSYGSWNKDKTGNHLFNLERGHQDIIRREFGAKLSSRLDDCFPVGGTASDCNFTELALIFRADYDFEKILVQMIENGSFFEVLRRIDFRQRLRKFHTDTALEQYAMIESGSFNVVEFINNLFFVPDCEYEREELLASQEEFINKHANLKVKKDSVKHWKIRKLICAQKNDDVPSELLKFSLDELPDELSNFYCSLNLIAFAAVEHKNLELLLFASKLLTDKIIKAHPKSSLAPSTIFFAESDKALYQGSGLVSRILISLTGSLRFARQTLEDLHGLMRLTGLRVLHQEWCRKYEINLGEFMEECFQFPIEPTQLLTVW